jgi:hypothetical protein
MLAHGDLGQSRTGERPGHANIGEQQIDAVRGVREDAHGLAAVTRLDDGEAQSPQILGRDPPDGFVIVDSQDDPCPGR